MAALPPHVGKYFTSTIHNDINPSTDPTKSDLSQPSKVVLITGAGKGNGFFDVTIPLHIIFYLMYSISY